MLSSGDWKTLWWFVHHEHSSYQSSSEKLNLDRCACKMHAGCMHSCQNEVGQNFIWLILPSGSDTFAHFCIFFHLLHFTTLHSFCHKWLMLLSSSKIIVPSNGQVQKPSLSCKKPACWFIKIWSNRDSKTMQDFLWKGGSTTSNGSTNCILVAYQTLIDSLKNVFGHKIAAGYHWNLYFLLFIKNPASFLSLC